MTTRGRGLVLVAVLVTFSAQQVLTPVLAPLARELGLTETRLGLVITAAAIALTVMSPVWGRALDRIGARAVLLAGLTLASAGLLGFAVVSQLGLEGRLGAGATFGLFLATRSALFGAGIAAVPVVAMAVAARSTTSEAERTRAIGLVGAAQGLSLVLGPAAGGALAAVSLLLPLYAAPAAVLLLWIAVAGLLRTATTGQPSADSEPVRVRPHDPRLLPVLAIGFALYLSLAIVQVVLGFLIADRLDLTAERAAGAIGLAFVVTGVVFVATQAALVPRLGWPPVRLLRVGVPLSVLPFALLAIADALWSITAAMTLLALSLGLAMPGYSAAATLAVGAAEQGTVAGLVNATNGLAFVVGPVLGTTLYEVAPTLPILTALAICLPATALVLTPALRLRPAT